MSFQSTINKSGGKGAFRSGLKGVGRSSVRNAAPRLLSRLVATPGPYWKKG